MVACLRVAFLADTQVPVVLASVAVAIVVAAASASTVPQSLVEIDIVGDPVVGPANVLDLLMVVDSSHDTADWLAFGSSHGGTRCCLPVAH